MVLVCAVLIACTVPAPTTHNDVCTTVQCFKEAQRKQYTKECVHRHMPQYFDLLSIGFHPEPPQRWCSEQAKRMVP